MSTKKEGRLSRSFQSSAFVNILKRISNFFYTRICMCKFAQALTSYDNLDKRLRNGLFADALAKIKPKKSSMIYTKKKLADKVENSFFYRLYDKIVSVLLGVKLRAYGVILFIIGLFSVGTEIIQKLLISNDMGESAVLWQGIVFVLLSIPLLISKEELCTTLVNGRITRVILKYIGYKKESVMHAPIDDNLAIPIIIGVVLGALSVVIQPIYLILLVFGLTYLVIVFDKPEFSTIIMVATLPFLPTMVICAEIIITFFAFIFKVLRGKRSFRLELLDLFVLIFSVFMFFGGIFSVSPSTSIPPACVFVCFLSVYFLIVNLIKTKELLSKLFLSSIFSFLICSLYGIYQNFFATPDTTWTDEDMFSEIETRVVSTFENPNVFGEYLIMLIPVAIAFVMIAKSFSGKSLSFFSLFAAILALVYTWSRGAWLGCIASLIIYFVIINRHTLGAYILGIIAVPLAIPILPESIIQRFSSIGNMTDSSTSYRVYIWEASFNMLRDYLVSGIGIGSGAFQCVYSEYALSGIETAPHSHNLYLQILLELGVLGFAVFIFTMFLFFSKVFTFMKDSGSRELKLIIGAVACGLLAILAQGLTDYVWYNYRVYAFFWMLLASASAGVNIYKEEQITEDIS